MSDLSALREFAVKQRSNIPSGGNHPEHGNELLRVIDRIQHQILSDDKFSKRRNSGNLNFVLRITIRLIIQGVNSSFQRINPTSGLLREDILCQKCNEKLPEYPPVPPQKQ